MLLFRQRSRAVIGGVAETLAITTEYTSRPALMSLMQVDGLYLTWKVNCPSPLLLNFYLPSKVTARSSVILIETMVLPSS
jgi:hypothetical protein